MRKYYLIAELLFFKNRWQNISVSNTVTCLATSLLFNRTTLLRRTAWDRAAVNLWNIRLHRSSSVSSQQSWPEPSRLPDWIWGKLQERDLYRSWMHDVYQLKSCLLEEGDHFHHFSSMKRSGSGVHVFEFAFEHTEDILNTDFSYVWYLYRRTLWQSAVAYSGHFCFGVTSLNPL